MRQAATHSQPIRHTIPPLFPTPVMLVQLINHHQSLEIAIHAPNVNKPNANWPNLNWMRDSRFSICDLRLSIRFDSIHCERVLFCHISGLKLRLQFVLLFIPLE